MQLKCPDNVQISIHSAGRRFDLINIRRLIVNPFLPLTQKPRWKCRRTPNCFIWILAYLFVRLFSARYTRFSELLAHLHFINSAFEGTLLISFSYCEKLMLQWHWASEIKSLTSALQMRRKMVLVIVRRMSVKLAPHYQHFSNFMRVLTSFAIVIEILIGFSNSSGLLMHKICDFRNMEITSRIFTLSEKQIFFLSSGKI